MILLDYTDRRPIYEQVVEKLQDLMVRGILEQDAQLPSVRSLATELSINPNTIQRAYAELERRGAIYSVKGRGSFVAANSFIRDLKRRQLQKDLEGWAVEAVSAGIEEEEAKGWLTRAYMARRAETGRLSNRLAAPVDVNQLDESHRPENEDEGGRKDDRSSKSGETV